MEQKQITATYAEAVKAIKEAILESRYRAARLVNKEVLALYYAIGGYISVQSRAARWGSNAIGTISELLQQELPGLRGFSETSIKRMRIFYEAWCSMFENRPLSADDLQNSIIPEANPFLAPSKLPLWSKQISTQVCELKKYPSLTSDGGKPFKQRSLAVFIPHFIPHISLTYLSHISHIFL